jgi:hypothetical protein
MNRPNEIIVKYHVFGKGEIDRFDTVTAAVKYMHSEQREEAIEYVIEVERCSAGIPHGFDRSEEFEKAWRACEQEHLTQEWRDTHDTEHSLETHLFLFAKGPLFTTERVKVDGGHDHTTPKHQIAAE